MSPFSAPKLVLSGIKEKIESVAIYGTLELSKVAQPEINQIEADRIYFGGSTGNLHIYSKCKNIIYS